MVNREDLGKMLERNLDWPVLSSGGDESYQKMVNDELQWGAEGFWNDVIDALIEQAKTGVDPDGMGYYQKYYCSWLEDQKIGDDE